MFPRAISRRLPAVGVRPLSTRKAHDCWGSTSPSRQSSTKTSVSDGTGSNSSIRPQHGSGRVPETASAAALSPVRRWRQGRQFSRGGRAGAPVTSSELAQAEGEEEDHGGGRESSLSVSSLGIEIGYDDGSSSASPTPPEAAGLRPETAPASTPLDLGCKAYYMATNIGIKAVCTVWFIHGFELNALLLKLATSVPPRNEQDSIPLSDGRGWGWPRCALWGVCGPYTAVVPLTLSPVCL